VRVGVRKSKTSKGGDREKVLLQNWGQGVTFRHTWRARDIYGVVWKTTDLPRSGGGVVGGGGEELGVGKRAESRLVSQTSNVKLPMN